MDNIRLNLSGTASFIDACETEKYMEAAIEADRKLHDKTGKGNDFLGWVNLPSSITEAEIAEIENIGKDLASKSEIIIVIGIGGSYLGAKAILEVCGTGLEALNPVAERPHVIFAGRHLDEDYLSELLKSIKGRKVSCIVISKSGTTIEPAIAFRIIKQFIEKEYGIRNARKRIVAVTDKTRGALKQTAVEEGYKTLVIPDDVGGRFSALTPVGLLPVVAAGFDVRKLLKGAVDMEKALDDGTDCRQNIALQYAAVRNCLYAKGKKVEILANYNPKLHFFTEWWKQLYGESEGKENKGIFPAGVDFTSDLHSMGQYIQEGERILFETVVSIDKPGSTLVVPEDEENLDDLNFMLGKRIHEINRMVELGTMLAHIDGDVPNIRVEVPELNLYYMGQLIYFFEKACGISGYILGINPFDQPGVEAYKKNMFALLGKPGCEKESEELLNRLNR